MESFWYKPQLLEHIKEKHNKADPETYAKNKKILLDAKDVTDILLVNKKTGAQSVKVTSTASKSGRGTV